LRRRPVKLILLLLSQKDRPEADMEEIHHTHKEPAWGWISVLNDWRRSRARARLRKPQRIVTPSSR
jgi:hypothetical protein